MAQPIARVMKETNKPFAEIIQSSLSHWLAQSWQWDVFAQFGSIVTIENGGRTLFGIVHQVNTGSMDPIRYPFPYKKTEEELRAQQPQIFEFLKTTFECLTIGYQEKGKIYYLMAPEPPKIHSFVQSISPEQARFFFANHHYLHLLFNQAGQLNNLDELLLALMRYLDNIGLMNKTHLQNIIQTYTLLTGNEYRRLKVFLSRTQQAIQL